MFPDSAESQCSLTTTSSAESTSPSQRTPNVYINGLPPHFPEQELFALARSFGEVKSVRTFTRHVSEKPTGYGFVLFSDVDSAERCIEGLRKYRNIHPSFSKQVHRIPGTEYAQHATAQSSDHDMNTFKSRMEKLKDTASTNLYIEGLPLSIDEESLETLVLPYKIKSSRFFKTKLSDPPRIIAFVRLENRDAAEETIERLHGRMVRGWNDSGCRISVRFADSAEQRELRRAERALKNGDQSPARLTIAQAALLNLRGQELQANTRSVAGGQRHRVDSQCMRLLSDNHVGFNSTADPGVSLRPNPRPSNLHHAPRESPVLTTQDLAIASDMDALLQSIQSMGYDDGLLDSTLSPGFSAEYLAAQQAQLRALASAALLSPNVLPSTLPRGQTQAHNGFTPAEELILEAHARLQLQAQSSQRPPVFEHGLPLAPLPTRVHNSLRNNLNASVSSFNTSSLGAAQTATAGAAISGRVTFRQDMLPTISEDDFHATGHHSFDFAPNAFEFQGSMHSGLSTGAPSSAFVRPPSRAVSIVPPPPDYDEHEKQSKGRQQRTEQSVEHSRIPIRSSSFDGRPLTTSNGYTAQQPYQQAPIRPNGITNNTSVISNHKNIEPQQNYIYSHGGVQGRRDEGNSTHFRSAPTSHVHAQFLPTAGEQHSEGSKSPDVVSPALTYSSRTPLTLSPATPFFGSFTTGQEAFEVVTADDEEAIERNLKARAGSK
ncbi:hypothetical protein PAXRUDRAFT_672772 [Paxillus rubicundulus Ve08.2h10]|uniref:RRM domain-containing protein n=1 Tax=Paxillus rubicundulus Ve08.2h10 TaxID=930991 RepID=A0A0D0D263_9AGAM|nr:hypothetical protein PAXRUDRAFT_672772 [Paxillus rubicundulus Ve08.2h10]